MIFEEVVQRAVEQTHGAMAAVIMARDGIALSHYIKPEVEIDLETLGIEYANLLADTNRSSQAMNAGPLKELQLTTDKYLTILRVLNPEYFIALIVAPDGNLGKGRFILRVSAPALLKELT
jgi:predicted regulator of Ras-like GTPase activity (Roadblock/LC7/MglB family)